MSIDWLHSQVIDSMSLTLLTLRSGTLNDDYDDILTFRMRRIYVHRLHDIAEAFMPRKQQIESEELYVWVMQSKRSV